MDRLGRPLKWPDGTSGARYLACPGENDGQGHKLVRPVAVGDLFSTKATWAQPFQLFARSRENGGLHFEFFLLTRFILAKEA